MTSEKKAEAIATCERTLVNINKAIAEAHKLIEAYDKQRRAVRGKLLELRKQQ